MRLLTAGSSVRARQGEPFVGAYDAEVPPVPIPNTEVKLSGAENTWRETSREDRTVPAQKAATAMLLLFLFPEQADKQKLPPIK